MTVRLPSALTSRRLLVFPFRLPGRAGGWSATREAEGTARPSAATEGRVEEKVASWVGGGWHLPQEGNPGR
ncbi:MAG: hypothetical protein QW356_04895 [Candidatus Hadarchaeales archaeon]